MEPSLYEVIKRVYRSRLLFRSEQGYRNLTGVSFETIRDRQHDDRAMSNYYDVLNRECLYQSEESLESMMTAYSEASEAYLEIGLDWRERHQLASRKKFCRMLFRLSAAPGHRLSVEENLKFGMKDCDKHLIGLFYPEGLDGGRSIDLIFMLLITFGVIRPFSLSSSRGRDLDAKEFRRQIEAMTTLVKTLRQDMPQTGLLPKPIVFDMVLETLRKAAEDAISSGVEDSCSAAWFWSLLNTIEDTCIALSSPLHSVKDRMSVAGYTMPGIWIDDTDEGRSRFWVFPENKLMAFCYHRCDGRWCLKPYEFCFYISEAKGEFTDNCVFVTAEGTRKVFENVCNGGGMDLDQVVSASYEKGLIDDLKPFGEISFTPETTGRPAWFDWNSFRRLEISDSRHSEFMQVLGDIYNPDSPHSMLFHNESTLLTDQLDTLIAIDNEFLYVSDMPAADHFTLRFETDGSERLWYEPQFITRRPATSLLNAEISPEHPLYLIPRVTELNRPMSPMRRRFAEAAMKTELSHQLTIYRTATQPEGILCFNNYSIFVPVSSLEDFGVRKITSRESLFSIYDNI